MQVLIEAFYANSRRFCTLFYDGDNIYAFFMSDHLVIEMKSSHLKVGLGSQGLSSHGMRGTRGGGSVVRGDVCAGRGDHALLLFHLG